jgi:hypothetical protein
MNKARRRYLADLQDAHRGLNSDAFMTPEPPRWPPEISKRDLSRAWLSGTAQPRYWEPKVIDPVATVTVPAASNSAKGSGPSLKEIERIRAAEQAAFAERLRQRWINNLSHLRRDHARRSAG